MLLKILGFLFCLISAAAASQTLGGSAAYNFLKLPSSPLLTAAGGINTSYKPDDVSLTANNPALLQPSLSTAINASFNSFLGSGKTASLTGAYHVQKHDATFGAHIYYVDYGRLPATDAAGNVAGEFRPVDFVVQVSAAKKYLEHWTYGGTLKFINSSYQQYNSSAIAMDFGLLYNDSANGFTASLLAKNMGVQLKSYADEKEDLPFDLQVGLTKRLQKAPFGFSLTAHHLHRFNLLYNDQSFNNENGFSTPSSFTKTLIHFVLVTHIYIGRHIEATIGYNALRRQELSIQNAGNGLTGFSAGLHIRFNKFQFQYAHSGYQRGVGYNQIGISTQLNKLIGLGVN